MHVLPLFSPLFLVSIFQVSVQVRNLFGHTSDKTHADDVMMKGMWDPSAGLKPWDGPCYSPMPTADSLLHNHAQRSL